MCPEGSAFPAQYSWLGVSVQQLLQVQPTDVKDFFLLGTSETKNLKPETLGHELECTVRLSLVDRISPGSQV